MVNVLNRIDWDRIDHVLLDLDGTILDRYFDDYFWEHFVPERYAEKNNISFGRAKEELFKRYKTHEGTLNWTDLDFWSNELNLDVPALKEQVKHLIEVHPHVEEFLLMLKRQKKRISLVTNAHYKSIDIKFKKTAIGRYFNSVITSFDMGHPKENYEFWKNAEKSLRFKREQTLLIDDTITVLRTAKAYGIRYLILKERPSSRSQTTLQPQNIGPEDSGEFISISDFRDLIMA